MALPASKTPPGKADAVWTRRMVEWGILAILLLLIVWVFGLQLRGVQAEVERAAVLSTLGAVRTTLVIDHLGRQVPSAAARATDLQMNPFVLMEPRPANYTGEMPLAQAYAVVPGSWLFDPACPCIAYVPMATGSLEGVGEFPVLVFRVDGAPGPLQIFAQGHYVWANVAIW